MHSVSQCFWNAETELMSAGVRPLWGHMIKPPQQWPVIFVNNASLSFLLTKKFLQSVDLFVESGTIGAVTLTKQNTCMSLIVACFMHNCL